MSMILNWWQPRLWLLKLYAAVLACDCLCCVIRKSVGCYKQVDSVKKQCNTNLSKLMDEVQRLELVCCHNTVVVYCYYCRCLGVCQVIVWMQTGWRFGLVVMHWPRSTYCAMSDPVSTRMGDRLWTGKPSRYVTSQLGQLSLLPSVGW